MKNKILSAIALAIASITTQASTPIDDVEYYIGAGIGWHALKDKNPTTVGDNYSISSGYLSVPIANFYSTSAGYETGNGNSEVTTQSSTSLEDKRQMSFSAFIGARQFFDQGFFVGLEGQVSKTKKGFVVTTQLKAQYKDGTGKFTDATVSQYEVQTSSNDSTGTPLKTIPQKNTVAAIGTTEIAKGSVGTASNSVTIKNSYTIAANVPVGMRFDIDNNVSVDVYGLLGYQYSKYKVSNHYVPIMKSIFRRSAINPTSANFNYSGFTYGAGFDINVQQFKIGARYVINHLSTKDKYLKDTNLLSKDTKDNTFSVNLSYVF